MLNSGFNTHKLKEIINKNVSPKDKAKDSRRNDMIFVEDIFIYGYLKYILYSVTNIIIHDKYS